MVFEARQRIGTNILGEIFNILKEQLKKQGFMLEQFTFIDASHLISKVDLWKERDKAIKKKYDGLNNKTLPKVAKDKQASFEGKNKFWYGFKKNISVDMQSGMINKVAITKANLPDSKGMKNVCPSGGVVYADKGYCGKNAQNIAFKKNVNLCAIKRNNMKDKNKELDTFYSKLRSPYERVFSKTRKRVRYLGIRKNQFTAFMESIVHNFKRMLVLKTCHLHPKY